MIAGILKIVAALAVDFVLAHQLLGIEWAVIATVCIGLYGWLGEKTALLKDNAVSMKYLSDYERQRLAAVMDDLTQDVKRVSRRDISHMKIHVIPSNQINAYSYGAKHIAVTRAALNTCDDMTLNAVLAHEVSHSLHLDAVFHRVILANTTVVIAVLAASSAVSVAFIFILFLLFGLLGSRCGAFSMLAFSGLTKGVKGFFGILQRMVLFIYQTVMGLVSRGCEYRADRYSAELGYGFQLKYFLERFVVQEDHRQRKLSEILYDSHPDPTKRIYRIEERMQKTAD